MDSYSKNYSRVSYIQKTSQAQFCLGFCMSLPEVSITIAGMTNEKEVWKTQMS